ncbi:MAG: hypothetical protein V1895_03210 [Parcubacteria group bacterium]
MSLVAAALLPHPKRLVQTSRVPADTFVKTRRGFEVVRELLIKRDVETLVTLSPRVLTPLDPYSVTPTDPSLYYVLGLDQLQVALPQLNDALPARVFRNDVDFSHQLVERARPFGLKLMVSPHVKVDEVSATALTLLNLPTQKQPLLVSLVLPYLAPQELYEFGQILGGLAELVKTKVAILAVADLSSRLAKNSPAGFDPLGKQFDELVQEAAASGDFLKLVTADAQMLERSGEEAARPLAVVAAAAHSLKPKLVSYEAPFGTGHAVLTWS